MVKKTRKGLEPVDIKRCQVYIITGSFMTYGPRKWVRCENKSTWTAFENKIPKGEKERGSMSMCDSCKEVYVEINGPKVVTFNVLK